MRRLVTSLLAVVLVVVPILSSVLKAAVAAELGPWPTAKAEGWARAPLAGRLAIQFHGGRVHPRPDRDAEVGSNC